METDFTFRNLTKSYGKNLVLDNVTATIPSGSITGVLGLNGVGKTTLFNCIAGFIDYDGEIVKEHPYDVSYMPTEDILFPEMTIKDAVGFYKDFMPGFDFGKAEMEIKRLNLDYKKPVRKLSMGQKRIVMFVLAVCCKAKIYLFDEPLTNLDIIYREYLVETLINTISDDKIYLISSHELLELENVFSHVMILKGNKLTPIRSVDEIRDGGSSIAEFYKETVKC